VIGRLSVFKSWCAIFALLGARAASAALVAGLDGTQNTTSPANFSYWNNIGYVPFGAVDVGGTAIYLGNDWVLTAGHVQGGNNGGYTFVIPKLNNGQDAVFTPVFASQVPLVLSPGGPFSDVTLFRVQDDPLLHSLPTIQFGNTPQIGTGITDIGSGYNRDATLHYWKLSDVNHPDTATWTDITSSPNAKNIADRSGYFYAAQPSFAKRWGTNTTVAVPGGGATFTFNNTQLFATVFDPNITNEMQLAPGDSGGGVFVNNRLVGLNLYKGDDSKDPSNPDNVGQPANTAVFGNASFYADLYSYVDQIANATKLHPSIDGDANLDGVVDIKDFDILYANLGTGSNWTQGDFNLDGKVDFLDFQTLESNFGNTSAVVTGAQSVAAVESVPEPGAVGMLTIAAAHLLARRRRP
jgi:hypothetical protein